ncbi:MAG: preprotein translocase subunit SecA [Candidatus Omnitrophica bacterium]|nr:preprotein translocase subunit SecA [Candidatus Omnitrophota bacterium]
MFTKVLSGLFGTRNSRELKRLAPFVDSINKLEKEVSALSDSRLREKTDEFKKRLAKGETQDALLPEAFSVAREVAKRTVKMRPFDVQLIGAIVLYHGKIAEMATGEGKTLVATLPTYLTALSGQGVHIITVNDYLARRDRDWMGPIYEFLGLSVGAIQHDMDHQDRQNAYRCDITYGTNNEFGFDYLRDHMVPRKDLKVQRELNYAIVDEVDSILIDEARTPLIISGPAEESTDKYYTLNRLVPRLKRGERDEETKQESGDYVVDEKARAVYLTEAGEEKACKFLNLPSLSTLETMEEKHHITQALRAYELFKLDVDYMLKDGKVVIVDEFTGRLMPGRRWSDGLHQAIEAKEKVRIEEENQTLATVTFQNYFRIYNKLAGMTGTAATEANEFQEIYKLEVMVIPPNRPLIRTHHPDVIYKTEREKFNAVVKEIEECNKLGRPALVGTISIEKSERLSHMLKKKNIPHNVLNARYHEKEAEIVARAGEPSAVTIATNMAGRGTDIVLGEGVAKKGGLHIVGTERHESRRVDNQLRGRAGRQGDPGSSRFYLALEDDLMRIFGSDRLTRIMDRLGMEEGQDIQHPLVTRAIETAQKRVEGHNFDIRKQLLEFDNVMNKQREVIYEQRDLVLESDNLKDVILDMIGDMAGERVSLYAGKDLHHEEWDIDGLCQWLKSSFGIEMNVSSVKEISSSEDFISFITQKIKDGYKEKETSIGEAHFRQLEKAILLSVVDSKWKDHLYAMDNLREGIGLRAYGQRDPLIEYQHEGSGMFTAMIDSIKEEVLGFLFKVRPAGEIKERSVFSLSGQSFLHPDASPMSRIPQAPPESPGQAPPPTQTGPGPQPPSPYQREGKKVGRNDPCPCGSNKKYKKCCGKSI